MEKVIYAVWREEGDTADAFNSRLLSETGPSLADKAHAVRLNLQDNAVAGGNSPRAISTKPQMDAVIQLWIDSAGDDARADVDAVIENAGSRFAAWLACEATPIANTEFPSKAGERTHGFSQVVFLGRPPRLTWQAWREIWQRDHTRPAIETQSNFEYQQNLIVRPLTYGAPAYAAMVEECFPEAALSDTAVYYDAVGDPAKLDANAKTMMDSVVRFIDFDRMDCMPTSQYDLKKLFG